MLSTRLKLKVENGYIQRTQPFKQKKENRIKIRHQLKYALVRCDTKY